MGNLTKRGRRFLKPRFTVQARKVRPPSEVDLPEGLIIDGQVLNKEESQIAIALTRLQWNFSVQVPVGGSRQLGSSLLDFVLHDFLPPINLEYQGAFHDDTVGQSQDLDRLVNRLQAGFQVITLDPNDVLNGTGHLIDTLMRKVGFSRRVGI